MKTSVALFVLLLLATAALPAGKAPEAGTNQPGPAAPAAAGGTNRPDEKAPAPENRVRRAPNGEVIVTLEVKTQQLVGLQTAALAAAELKPELKAYGRVLDISSLASLVADVTSARATSEASQAELQRLKTLAAQNNASERALQAAQATAARDQAQMESARLRLLAGWGSAIADQKDLAEFVQSLGSLASVLVELDVPAGEPLEAQPQAARLVTLATETKPVAAEFLGPAPAIDPQLQGRGFLFLVSSNRLRLAPGAAVTGFLELPGPARPGVLLPRSAVIQYNGVYWVYLQTGETTFQRHQVALEAPLTQGWFVPEGLKAQDKVVVTGAQDLLSEELKGQGGE